MKAVFCLLALAATAMAVPIDPVVSEANLAIQSQSDLVTSGNGLYNPVRTVYRPVIRRIVPERQLILQNGVQDVVIGNSGLGLRNLLVYPRRLRDEYVLVQ